MLHGRRQPAATLSAAQWAAWYSRAPILFRRLATASFCVVGLAFVMAFDGSRAVAGCGDYIHFRGHFRGVGIAGSDTVTRNSPSTAVPTVEIRDGSGRDGRSKAGHTSRGFSAVAHLLGLRLAVPLSEPRVPCHGPECQQRPPSPTLPATTLVWLESHDAMIPGQRAVASPSTAGHRLEGEAALLPVHRPLAIFRPPR